MAPLIAALFVQTNGCYFGIPEIEPWDEQRDARLYPGPYPVVAHPPCQLWGPFAKVNYVRWGGDHNRPGNDGGCFASAFKAVNQWGGVLEHPAGSAAWAAHGILRPSTSGGWSVSGEGWVCEVWQSAYGHRARKRTWLYYKGPRPFELRWEHTPGTHQIGGADQRGKLRNKPTLSKREASATPASFRDELIRLSSLSIPLPSLN